MVSLLDFVQHLRNLLNQEQYEQKSAPFIKIFTLFPIFPYWVAILCSDQTSVNPVCLDLNHPLGNGCPLQACQAEHVCLLCHEKGHGVFQLQDQKYLCPSYSQLDEEFQKKHLKDPFSIRNRAEKLRHFLGIITKVLMMNPHYSNEEVLQIECEEDCEPVAFAKYKLDTEGNYTLELTSDRESLICESHYFVQVRRAKLVRYGVPQSVAVKLIPLCYNTLKKKSMVEFLQEKIQLIANIERKPYIFDLIYSGAVVWQGRQHFLLVMPEYEMDLNKFIPQVNEFLLPNFVRQAIVALQMCVENNISHRDIKPENFLIENDLHNGQRNLRLCDFEFSKLLEGVEKSMYSAVGTSYEGRCWKSPELLQEHYYILSDVWSLGLVIYFLATKGQILIQSEEEAKSGDHHIHSTLMNRYPIHPLMRDLVCRLVRTDRFARLPLHLARVHPATWSSENIEYFLEKVLYTEWMNKNPKAIELIEKSQCNISGWITNPALRVWFQCLKVKPPNDSSNMFDFIRAVCEVFRYHREVSLKVSWTNAIPLFIQPLVNCYPQVILNLWENSFQYMNIEWNADIGLKFHWKP